MLIKSAFDIQFQLPQRAAMVAMLHLHPSLERYVRQGNVLVIEHLATASVAVRDRLPGRHWVVLYGRRRFQCVVRGLAGWTLVHDGCAPQRRSARARADGDGAGRGG